MVGHAVSWGAVFSRVFAVFFLMLFGILARHYRLMKDEAQSSFADVVLFITVPALIFASITSGVKWTRLSEGIVTPLVVIVTMAVVLGLGWAYARVVKMNPKSRGTFLVLCTIPNSGFLGFPIVLSFLGKEGLAYAVLYDLGLNVILWTVVIALLRGGRPSRDALRALLNPALFAVVAGIVIVRLGVTLPRLVVEPMEVVGGATVPMAMMLLGYMLAGLKFRLADLNPHIIAVAFAKLLVFPAVALAIVRLLHLDSAVSLAIVLESAMPSMASAPVFAYKYGGDRDFATITVLVTTTLALVSIPLVYSIAVGLV